MTDASPRPPESTVSTQIFSPLHSVHVAAGAGFTDFAGWQMPVRYSSDLAEHHAVRTAAGIFDLSHMAEIGAEGPEAAVFLDYALAGKLSAIAIGQAKYSLLLADDGTIVDDVVVYRTAETSFLVVANAGNHAEAVAAFTERAAGFDAEVADESDTIALIAVQGPRALEVVETVLHLPLADLKYYWTRGGEYAGQPLLVARTGYTGEDGFELYVRVADAEALWAELMAAGSPFGMVPAGLASRDTLRLEAGMPLYGHELDRQTLPAQAGLGRVANLTKGDFVGRAALEAPASPTRVLVGLTGEGKRAARAGYEIYPGDGAGDPIGVITSGALSPTLGHPIAMAYVDPRYRDVGTELAVDIRGKRLPFRVTELPFYRRKRD